MKATKEQIKGAYQKLPLEAEYFVRSNETSDIILELLRSTGLTEDQIDLADTELFYSMLNLQSFDNAINNIASLSQKPIESLKAVKTQLKEKIFDKLEEIKKTSEPRKEEPVANLPMVEPGEVAHEVPHVEEPKVEVQKEEIKPAPKPVEPPSSAPKVNHYPGGLDPYREPID